MNTTTEPSKTETPMLKWGGWALVVGLALHFALATGNFGRGFMGGHEFRQAQTALIAEYIDKQNNFGLYYETPILGKPWAFPLEVPIYQWTVVGLKRAIDLKDFEAARVVSLASFYLTLPALFLLLGSMGLSPGARCWALLPVLVCPVYLFYSRAFLIDPMAAMFSAWFLAAFVRTMDRRHWGWWLLATVSGTLGILIKSLVFAVWLFPAAVYGAWSLYRSWRSPEGRAPVARTAGWGLSVVVLPGLLWRQWVAWTDAIKADHPSAFQFTSAALSKENFGTFSLASRIDPETWQIMAQRWAEAIAPAWGIALIIGGGLALAGHLRKWVLGLIGLWFFGQLAFPYAYALQDYYFYAGTWFLMLAAGVAVTAGLQRSAWPAWLRLAIPVGVLSLLTLTYFKGGYRDLQMVQSDGGSGLTALLRDMLPRDSVIMIIGHDWAAIIPYYAQRRALMVRDALRYDRDYLERAIASMDDEDIAALLVSGDLREHPERIREITRRLGMFDQPLLNYRGETDVYFGTLHFRDVARRLQPGHNYPHVEVNLPGEGFALDENRLFVISTGFSRAAFVGWAGQVKQFQIANGYRLFPHETGQRLNFHAEASLWWDSDRRFGTLRWSFGIFDDAWQRPNDQTNGVVFAVDIEAPDGSRKRIFQRIVDPLNNPEDRGLLQESFDYGLNEGECLVFRAEPYGSAAYDWAYVAGLEFVD